MKRELLVRVTVDWDDYDDVSDEMMFADVFDNFDKDGVDIDLMERSADIDGLTRIVEENNNAIRDVLGEMNDDVIGEELRYLEERYNHEYTLEFHDFQLKHSVQIVKGADYQYMCYIDGKVYAVMLTFMGALVEGIEKYNLIHEQ